MLDFGQNPSFFIILGALGFGLFGGFWTPLNEIYHLVKFKNVGFWAERPRREKKLSEG